MTERFFRHVRLDNKALQALRQSNRGGMYVEIAMYQGGRRNGIICIPEGRQKQGWLLLGEMLQNFREGKTQRLNRTVRAPPPRDSHRQANPRRDRRDPNPNCWRFEMNADRGNRANRYGKYVEEAKLRGDRGR